MNLKAWSFIPTWPCELKKRGISFQLNLSLVTLGFSGEGHSCCRAWALEHVGSGVAAHGLRCLPACEKLVLWPGIEPMSSALQGRCLTTGPQGKSLLILLEYLHYARSLRYKNWRQPLPSRSSESRRKAGIHNVGRGTQNQMLEGDRGPQSSWGGILHNHYLSLESGTWIFWTLDVITGDFLLPC